MAPELAVRSRPRSVGAPALHLMHAGCLCHHGAPAAGSRSPWRTPARALNAQILPACDPLKRTDALRTG